MKILFIMAGDINYQSHGLLTRRLITNLEPLGLTILAALVPEELGAEIRIVDEGTEPGSYAGQIADIVGIYCCTSSAERAYSLCRYWKRKGAFVVLGGPHPTLCPEEAAAWADAVAVGAAEETWPRILSDFLAGKAEKIYRQDPGVPLTSPFPRRDLVKRGYVRIPSVMANRGCNYACDYCILQNIWKGLPHKRPVGEVVDEIKRLNAKYLILLDPSPISDKAYALELFEAIRPLKVWWAGQATLDLVKDPELLDLMQRSGCSALFIGFETFSQSSLDRNHKGFNDAGKFREAVSLFHERGIAVAGGFILGADGDTEENIAALPDMIDQSEIDLARIAIFTPYPGTAAFAAMERDGRLLHRQWHLYDEDHVVFRPERLSAERLQELFYRTVMRAYSWKRIFKRTAANKVISTALFLSLSIGFRKNYQNMMRRHRLPYRPDLFLNRY